MSDQPNGDGAADQPPRPGSGTPRIHQLRARYARRVTPEHLGQRVSVRHLLDDPDRGPIPSDVVGRLVGADDEAMLIVDREGQLTVLDTASVLSSRVIPPHPKLPAEPEVGTRDQPLPRRAARVLLLDADDHVLLVAHAPDAHRRVWTAPGGGLRDGETHREAAHRELQEEIGIDDEPGPWIWSRRVTFSFRGCWIDQDERWFLTRTTATEAEAAPLDDPGAITARWWSLQDLRETDAELAPATLEHHLGVLLTEGPPKDPIDVGR
ncbi:MAG: NUDIX domain-containing protein [Nitriliruptoraceae bacterium]